MPAYHCDRGCSDTLSSRLLFLNLYLLSFTIGAKYKISLCIGFISTYTNVIRFLFLELLDGQYILLCHL